MTSDRQDKKQTIAIAVLTGAMIVICAIVIALVVRPPVVVNPSGPLPEPVAEGDAGEKFYGGWVDDRDAREAVKASLPVGQIYFGDTPAGRAVQGDDTKDVLLTDAAVAVLGSWLPIRNQGDVGSCVSFGTATAIEHLLLIQIANAMNAGLPPPEYRDLVQEVIYGGSRVEVGGGRIRGDGSVTAWAGEFVKKWGVVPRGVYGDLDLSAYSTRLCRKLGSTGVPDNLETVARESPVKGITFVRNADEAWKAIGQGYPIAVGAQLGFGSRGPWNRDQDGFVRASGSWSHCTAILGRVTVGNRKGFLLMNSWGDSVHRGPKGGKNIPDSGCFFVEYATADRMFREGDAIAFSDAVGFPARRLPDFWINAPRPQKELFAGVDHPLAP
jgi:hypothetical protein